MSFSFSRVAQPEVRGPSFSGYCFLYRILSPTGLVSKLTDFLSSPSYIIVQRPLLVVGVTIELIQPIHAQGYNSDIPRPDAPVIYIGAFPILTGGRVVCQYTTLAYISDPAHSNSRAISRTPNHISYCPNKLKCHRNPLLSRTYNY